eukprot:gene20114-24118_t
MTDTTATKKKRKYVYKPIAQLEHDSTANVYGFVISVTPIKESARGDTPEDKINVTIFFQDAFNVADITPGSIVRFHRLRNFDTLTGTGNVDSSSSHFTMIYVKGAVGGHVEYVSRTQNTTWTDADRQRVEELRVLWHEIKHLFVNAPGDPIDVTTGLRCLGDLKENMPVQPSIVCQVLDKSFYAGPNSKKITLRVWDGTGDGYEYVPPDGHRLGRVLNVISWEPIDVLSLDRIEGEWIMLRNVRPHVYNGQLEIKLSKVSKVIPMNSDSSVIVDILKVADILSPNMTVPKRHKINAKLVQHIPMNIQNFTRPYCRDCNTFFDMTAPDLSELLIFCPNCKENRGANRYL